MRLKTTKTKDATNACKDQLLRRGFEPTTNLRILELRLQNKPSEVYEVLFSSDGYRKHWFVRIQKGTVGSKTSSLVYWDWTNTITLRLV